MVKNYDYTYEYGSVEFIKEDPPVTNILTWLIERLFRP